MALRLCEDTIVPKYKNGKWLWDEEQEKFKFIPMESGSPDWAIPTPKLKFGIQFKDHLDQIDEIIFRSQFARPQNSHDADVITLEDIKDLVFYTAPSEALTDLVVDFFHTETVDRFLDALIIYFEDFLKVVEFLLIRQDEGSGDRAKLRNEKSNLIGKMLAKLLVRRRLLVAREYSKIILGKADMKKFYHHAECENRSKTIRDKFLHEHFISYCTQIVWIAMFRRAYTIIDVEINRLLRSGHFNVAEKQFHKILKFSKIQQQILYGPNDKRTNYRMQRSPLIEELDNVKPEDADVLWIGERKYRGKDPQIKLLELEHVVPDSQLSFIGISHGILGHRKSLYNTMLTIDWHAVRRMKYSEDYDPYNLIKQPRIDFKYWNMSRAKYERENPHFKIIDVRREDDVIAKHKRLWKNRDKIIKSTNFMRIEDFNIVKKCQREIEKADQGITVDREKIVSEFLREKAKLRKQKKSSAEI